MKLILSIFILITHFFNGTINICTNLIDTNKVIVENQQTICSYNNQSILTIDNFDIVLEDDYQSTDNEKILEKEKNSLEKCNFFNKNYSISYSYCCLNQYENYLPTLGKSLPIYLTNSVLRI
jgi:hypothetical protein